MSWNRTRVACDLSNRYTMAPWAIWLQVSYKPKWFGWFFWSEEIWEDFWVFEDRKLMHLTRFDSAGSFVADFVQKCKNSFSFETFPDDRLIRIKSWMNSTVFSGAEAEACRTVALSHCRTAALTLKIFLLFLARLGIEGHKLWGDSQALLRRSWRITKFCISRKGNFLDYLGNGG